MNFVLTLLQNLRAKGLQVVQKESQTSNSIYLLVYLNGSLKHPVIKLRLSDHPANEVRLKTMDVDIDLPLSTKRSPKQLAIEVKTMIMRRLANHRKRKLKK